MTKKKKKKKGMARSLGRDAASTTKNLWAETSRMMPKGYKV